MADGKDKVTKLPPVSVLKSLINKSANIKTKVGELNGEVGEAIAKAVKDHNLHASAFKTARKLAGMDPVALHSWLTHFDDYREKLELDVKAGEALDLGDGAPKPPMFEGGDGKPEGGEAGVETTVN